MYVIGTAGHVDHGKSTLVKALTSIDPDRLQEEKEREMTIELGFAWLTLPSGREVSVVDVPGHERFIKNMLAGVGGMDLAMLVVAANESVMPQTREHLAILDLLRVKKGLVVLSKTDLVDDEWLGLVKLEVADTLQGSSLEGGPIAPVSAATGQGLEELKTLLDRLLKETPPRRDLGRPRLAVDRAFTMTGFGTVVTGTLLDGSLAVGQEVALVPSGQKARIRGLQAHRQRVESIGPGRRVAVNLSGVGHDDVQRGEVLTTPGWLTPVRTVSSHLRLTPWAPHGVKHNLGVTFHVGTSETGARLRLLDAEELKPGQEGWAQLHLQHPLPLVKGDSFVIRSSQWTLGGGEVVEATPRRLRRFQPAALERLEVMDQGSIRELLLQVLGSGAPVEFAALIGQANIPQEEARQELEAMAGDGAILVLGGEGVGPGSQLFSADGWSLLREQAGNYLQTYHVQYPLRPGVAREELRERLKLAGPVFPRVLARLAADGVLEEEGPLVRAVEHRVRLTQDQENQAQAFVATLEEKPYAPPSDTTIAPELLGVLIAQNRVVRVKEGVVFSADAYRQMLERVVGHLREHGKITVADVRDMFGTSRKYALPLMEYLDQQQITRRTGDERVLGSRQ